jgi:ribonuclease HI
MKKQYEELVIHSDGGSRGNPGKAAIGFTIHTKNNELVAEYSEYIGIKTNNEAEYMALDKALETALSYTPRGIQVYADSELMINQLNGRYKVSVPTLQELHASIKDKCKKLQKVTFTHVLRAKNKHADKLVNMALDGKPVNNKTAEKPAIKTSNSDTKSDLVPAHANRVFKGKLYEVYQWDQERFDKTIDTYEAVVKNDVVHVIAVTKDKKIIVLEEEQPSIGKFRSVPSGRIETSETPEDAANRELQEEIGVTPRNLTLFRKFTNRDGVNNHVYIMVATDCEKTSKGSPESGEKIQKKVVSLENFLLYVASSDFRHNFVKAIILEAIQYPETMAKLKKLLGV